jgi:predicted  nucleic acid-binding Zn-ribbon protein
VTSDLNARRAADFEETAQVKIGRLERTLSDERKHSVRATTQLHKTMVRDLVAAEKRADAAEKRVAGAERRAAAAEARAERAERRLATVLASSTWRAGRAVAAVPARIKRLRRS